MIELFQNNDLINIYENLKSKLSTFLRNLSIDQMEISYLNGLLKENIYKLPEKQIKSSGYVIETLEASIWCLLSTKSYTEAVLKAINLGYDTDTTGCVTGAIAGLYYGYKNIPEKWINEVSKSSDIEELSKRLYNKINWGNK
jgi:ADP-ribosylglycohydrolase